jgi:hypothetical protein
LATSSRTSFQSERPSVLGGLLELAVLLSLF